MADGNHNDDLWAQLLGAAKTEAARHTEPPAEPAVGTFAKGSMLLDTYRIESEPMHGGMGDVWRVHHTGWNADLAMKRPKPEYFATEANKEGFIDECRNWIDLGLHPNIVSCYYVREIDGVPTIFSEWMENGDLERHIQKGTLYDGTEEELQARLLDIAIQYARGLHYAHAQGLIHQDVKPANLLLTNDWQAKAADFGLANARARLTVLEGEPTLRDAGETLNAAAGGYTPAYCSMEQMDGKKLTRRTDIYSWAVSVMEMYVGGRPWTNGVVAGAGCRDYMAMDGCRVNMPPALQELLAKCMEINADDRPHDFAAIETELLAVWRDITGKPYPRPEPEAASDTPDSLNNMALTYLDLGMPEKAEQYWVRALAQKPDHLAAVYNQGLYQWRNGSIRYDTLLQRCGNADAVRDGAGLAERWKSMLEAEHTCEFGRSVLLGKSPNNAHYTMYAKPHAILSPDGKRIYCAIASSLLCRDAETLENRYNILEAREPGHDYAKDLYITQDSRYLLGFSGYRTVWVADAETGKTLRYLCRDVEPAKKQEAPGPRAVFSAQDVPAVRTRKPGIQAVCLYPDGTQAAVLWENNRLILFDLATGNKKQEISAANPAVRGWKAVLRFSPDGRTLYMGTTMGMLCAMDMASGQYRSVLDATPGRRMKDMHVSRDGRTLWTCSEDGTFLRVSTGAMEPEPLKLPCPLRGPFWVSGDGRRILAMDPDFRLRLWDPETGELLRTLRGEPYTVYSLDAREDLSLIVSGHDEKGLQLWDANAERHDAPWELCRMKAWGERIHEQQDTDRLQAEIEDLISKGKTAAAVRMLEDGENRYDPLLFLPQRRKLARICRPGALNDIVRLAEFTPEETGYGLEHLAADPRGGAFAMAYNGESPVVCLYSETGRLLSRIVLPKKHDDTGCLRYSPDGRLLAAACTHAVVLIDPDSGKIVRTLGDPEKSPFMEYASPVFSPDGRILVAAGDGKENDVWGLWDVETGRLLRKLEEPPVQMHDSVFCFLDSGRLLSSTGFMCKSLVVHDAGTGRVADQIRVAEKRGSIEAFTPDAKKVFLEIDKKHDLEIWDTERWEKIGELPSPTGKHIYHLCVSPDGGLLAGSSGESVYIWSLPGLKLLREMSFGSMSDIAFSGDGCLLGIRTGDTVRVFDLLRELQP